MKLVGSSGSLVHLLSSTIVSQALLSGSSFAVGLLLIRQQNDAQYGYYVLITVALLLLASLQNAYFGPDLAIRLHRERRDVGRDLTGGVYRVQRVIVAWASGLAALFTAVLWLTGVLDGQSTGLILAAIAAAAAVVFREYFRLVLMIYQQPLRVLVCDVVHVTIFVGGAFISTLTAAPALGTVIALALAATTSGIMLAVTLWRHEPWNIDGAPTVLRDFFPVGMWSMSGSAIHWGFSQGYTYIVAAMLDVQTLAAIAATRLLLMPVNLLSSGIMQTMVPTASRWLNEHGVRQVYRRLMLFCAGFALILVCYLSATWILRDWIFTHVLKKQFADRDALLALWGAIFLCTTIRDQTATLLIVRGRQRQMSTVTLVCAVTALTTSFLAIRVIGATGALAGLLLGELISFVGICFLAYQELGRAAVEVPLAPGPEPYAS